MFSFFHSRNTLTVHNASDTTYEHLLAFTSASIMNISTDYHTYVANRRTRSTSERQQKQREHARLQANIPAKRSPHPFSRESLHAGWNEKVLESLGVSIPVILILQVKSADIEASHQRGPPYLVSAPWPCIEVITGPSMGLLERRYARGSARCFTKPSLQKGCGEYAFSRLRFWTKRSLHTRSLYNTHFFSFLSIDLLYTYLRMHTHTPKERNKHN